MSWLDTLEDIRKKDFTSADRADQDKAARDVVNMASYACAVVAVSPIPFSDAVLMLPVQSAMVMTVGHIYGRKLTQADAKELILELGTTAGVSLLARQGIKALLPVVGALLTVPAAFAANWAIGRVAIEYFRNPGLPREQLKKIYKSARDEGAKLFSRERFDAFRKGQSKAKADPDPSTDTEDEGEGEGEGDDDAGKTKPKTKVKKKSKGSRIAKIVEGDFAKRLAKHPQVVTDANCVIHLDITGADGGQWTVDLTRKADWIRSGHSGKPRLTLRCAASQFADLLEGKTNAQLAVLSGDLVLDPMDLELVAKLSPLFR